MEVKSTLMSATASSSRRTIAASTSTSSSSHTHSLTHTSTANSNSNSTSTRASSAPRAARSAVAGVRSASPSASLTRPTSSSSQNKNDEINRKLDYLLKKTKKLEDSLASCRSENATLVSENKKTQECTVNMWESIKKDRDSVSLLRSEMSSIRVQMDLLNQQTTLLDTRQLNKSVRMEEIGAISEQVFTRVHREFSTVVDEVVRACVKEQVDFLTKWTSKGGLEKDAVLVEENKALRTQMDQLKRRQQDLETSLSEMADTNHEFILSQEASLTEANEASRKETHHLLESITKRMNDTVSFTITQFQDEISTKYDSTMHQLIKSSNDLQVRIAESEEQLATVEASIADTHEHTDIEIANLSNVVANTKDSVQRLDEGYEEMKEEFATFAERQQQDELLKENREENDAPRTSTLSSEDHEVLAAMEEQVSQHEEDMARYLQLLEQHREDYTETISRLSAAGRQAKASHQELADEVQTLREEKATSDENLANLAEQCEEDRAVLSKLSKDNTKLFASIIECQKGLASKKNKKKGGDEGECTIDVAQVQEVSSLKERMDVFEESVIETVEEMIATHKLEALGPLEKRLLSLELQQEKYNDLVKSSVDTFHSAEIIPIVSSVNKVERLLESMTTKLSRDPVSASIPTDTSSPPPARPLSISSDIRTRLSSEPLHASPGPSKQVFKQNIIPSASVPVSHSYEDVSPEPIFSGNLHSSTVREKKTLSSNPDATHKPKFHPPQSFNLTNTLTSAHEMMPATGIPNLSTLPDLRKTHREKKPSLHSDDSDCQPDARDHICTDPVHVFPVTSYPSPPTATRVPTQAEKLLKSLQEKKLKHRTKFQSMVKSEMHAAD